MWYPLSLTTTLRKATRVTFERQDDAMNYKMTVKAKVSSGFADTKEKDERERERYEVRCTAEPSNRPTSQPPPNLMKQRRVRLLTGEAPSKCLGKVAGCYMTCPRMWKCNVYTFNHVLSHRSPPSPPRIRNYVRLSSPLFIPRSRVTTTSTLNYASILLSASRSSNAARPPIPFSRGEREQLSFSVTWRENPLKWMRGGFWRWWREDASSRGWPGSNLSHCLRATNMQIQNRLREHFHIRNDAVTREIQRDVSWIISFLGRTGMFRTSAIVAGYTNEVSRYSYRRL